MPIPIYGALHYGADAVRLRGQGVQCFHGTAHVAALSPIREAIFDLYAERASRPIRQIEMIVPVWQWDWWRMDLLLHFKSMRAGKLDRVLVLFEVANDADRFFKARPLGFIRLSAPK
jgi:hypothetical protein